MIIRNLLQDLTKWKSSPDRRPLILRGARQTGKTTLIRLFGESFEQMVTLNLDLASDRRNWQGDPDVGTLLRNIEVSKNIRIIPGKTLLFLDEIQNEPKAIQSLRYLYELHSDLHVVATGSLMEVALQNRGFSFPVGRVSFLYLYPVTFDEFVLAVGRESVLEELNSLDWKTSPSPALHSLASEIFEDYAFVGGMPEVVQRYVTEKSYLPLNALREGLMSSFEEDVPKYAKTSQVPYVQLCVREAPLFAGQRICYANFANSGFKSREMRQAFDLLEQAMLIQRVSGTHVTVPPLQPDRKVAPKLIYLDMGLVAHRLSVDPRSLKQKDLNDLFRGTLAEQIVGQELLAQNRLRREPPHFWHRYKPGSTAEVDYCISVKGTVIPIEVKSGKGGSLRSLLQFMDKAPEAHVHTLRIYSGPLQRDELRTPKGKKVKLLSLPFFLAYRLSTLVERWVEED